MFEVIQEEEEKSESGHSMSRKTEKNAEGETRVEKECSALFWEEGQELSPLMCGSEGGEWEILTVTVDSGAAD
eukprot:3278268-Karenia_brevis.AAC.1